MAPYEHGQLAGSIAAELAQMLAPGGAVAGKIGKAAKLGALDKKTKKLREALEKLAKDTPDAHNNWLKERASGAGYAGSVSKVAHMGQFFKSDYGKSIKDQSTKTSKTFQGQSVYKAEKKMGHGLKKGDHYYLDNLHKDHIEVFDKSGNFRHTLNLDGTINADKTAKGWGRQINL